MKATKLNLNINLTNGIIFFTAFCLLNFSGCEMLEKPDFIPPKGEIINIYNITDSTANVDVKVTQQSNTGMINYFRLLVDSTSNDGPLYCGSIQTINLINDQSPSKLNDSYSIKISKLKSKTRYYLHLSFAGRFSIGGPSEDHAFFIGDRKSFTTK